MLKPPPLNEANFIRCTCLGGIHGIEIDHDPKYDEFYFFMWFMGRRQETLWSRIKGAWQLFRYGRVIAEDYVFNRADMERLQERLNKILEAAADED